MKIPENVDVLVVGSGIVGLAHAYEAWRQGARVAVVDAAATVHGASVRNFGHACITPQAGAASSFAEVARTRWLELAGKAGFFARESGTTVVARRPEEIALLEQFAAGRDDVELLDRAGVGRIVDVAEDALGGAFLPRDLQVDPREAAPAIARWLESVGVAFLWRATVASVATGTAYTSRGEISAERIVVCVNHDVDRLFPDLAEQYEVTRCRLHMLKVSGGPARPRTPVLTGWSLLRYAGFAGCPASADVRDALSRALPAGIEYDLNQMYTSPPDGTVIVGDTHARAVDAAPFQPWEGFDLLLDETRRLFPRLTLDIVETWQGVYATSPRTEFLIAEPIRDVHVVTVTTGIGMTTGLGIAPSVLS
ncbi:TIGR03364 family FAD-dependent oxidoreductase [Kocuria coralli]|uniref:TIGR03364 family FAD-dependent oxidoreductase n=1 Tax=Kocuria coralli TaxID=1461025 RepID=A0A5J5KWA0_9MICC|nr:TIGR03364 family FAD-dependent oxidoreductase [Kocuria coralli]KAA9393146.1 TIGR03364 family FAD-dependent oxidoreductase [Kocuria coralli]